MVAAIEVAVYRLAVPALRPPDGAAPSVWQAAVGYAGLFLFYFASALAGLVLVRQLLQLRRGDPPTYRPLAYLLVVSGTVLVVFAGKSMMVMPSEADTFVLELAFATSLGVLMLMQLGRGGDVAVKIGLLLLAAPLLVHFYRDASVRWILGPESLWEGAADRIDAYGQWSVVLAALMSPYCFAPRPFTDSAGKLAPLAIGAFVGVVGALVMRQSYEVGHLLAKRGLGIELGPGAPTSQIALYLIALGSMTWTLASSLMAEAPARRRVGVGLGLVVASGYAFAWPLQYLAGLVGFFTIAGAARDVSDEEHALARRVRVARPHGPRIPSDSWQAYVAALVAALRTRGYHAQAVSVGAGAELAAGESPDGPDQADHGAGADEGGRASGGRLRTHVLVLDPSTAAPASAAGASSEPPPPLPPPAPLPVRLTVERWLGAVVGLEVVCGREVRASGREPSWILEARRDCLLGGMAHPSAPDTRAPLYRTGDHAFDRRFRVRDLGGLTERLFDDGLRARAAALFDGWMAYWPGESLVYRVVPGVGAPLDNPIPIRQLAFGGHGAAPPVERLVTLLELLARIAERGLADEWARRAPEVDPLELPAEQPAADQGSAAEQPAAAEHSAAEPAT